MELSDPYALVLDCDKKLKEEPNSWIALTNRGAGYLNLCLYDEAIRDLGSAIHENPKAWEPHFHLGCVFHSQNHLSEAQFHLRMAVELSGGHRVAETQLAVLFLSIGRWEEAFKYDRRRFTPPEGIALWNGEDLNGKHLLFMLQGGQGDQILSLRYINSIQTAYPNAELTVVCSRGMMRLVKINSMVRVEESPIKADYAQSALHVPHILNIKVEDVPRQDHYLFASPDLKKEWERRLSTLPPGLKIGICRQSSNNISKSIPPMALEELNRLPDINLISLQPEETKVEDWADTAALISILDLVISVDTGVAHLAGALGKPVWNLVKFENNWPWLHPSFLPDPTYSIWYPSMKLYRQHAFNDWIGPMRRVILDLRRKIEGL